MAQGKRPDVDSLAALLAWSGLDTDDFVLTARRKRTAEPLAMISTYLRTDKNLTTASAEALDQIVKAAYESMRKQS
jgi:hypothetical protein